MAIDKMADFASECRFDSIDFVLIDTVPEKTDFLMLNRTQRKQLDDDFRKISS